MSYLLLLGLGVTAHASAPNTPIVIDSPIPNGIFDEWAVAYPSYHHAPWGGDWATDIYGVPGSQIVFNVREYNNGATPGAAYGIVVGNASSCASPYDLAGTAYQVDVYDGSGGYVGWVLYAHVDTSGVAWLPVGTVIASGTVLGHTAQWAYSNCYQVTNAGGVHTHFESYNAHDYSCYVPWASGTSLPSWRAIGGLGTNKTGPQAPCW